MSIFLLIIAANLVLLCLGSQKILQPEEASSVLDENELVVATFIEDWCDACYKMLPIMESIEESLAGQGVRFTAINLDNDKHAWQLYGVEALPHVALFSDGSPVGYSGELQRNQILNWIETKAGKKPVPLGGKFD